MINHEKLLSIQAILQEYYTENNEEMQAEIQKNSSEESPTTKMNFDREIKAERDQNYLNLVPFKIEDLSSAEKQKLADNLFYEYFESLGNNKGSFLM